MPGAGPGRVPGAGSGRAGCWVPARPGRVPGAGPGWAGCRVPGRAGCWVLDTGPGAGPGATCQVLPWTVTSQVLISNLLHKSS